MTKFYDSYGAVVRDGDEVLLEQTHGRRLLEGKRVKVEWDSGKGLFRFSVPGLVYGSDFHGIDRFRRLSRSVMPAT